MNCQLALVLESPLPETQALGGSSVDPSHGAPSTCVGELDQVPHSQLQPGPNPDLCGYLGSQATDKSSLSLQ